MEKSRTFIAYHKDDESKKPMCFLETKNRVVELCASWPEEVDKSELVEVNLEEAKGQIEIAGSKKWLVPGIYGNDHLLLLAETEQEEETPVILTSDDAASGRNAFSMGRPLNRCWIMNQSVLNELQQAGVLTLLQEQNRVFYVLYYCQVDMVELWKHTEQETWDQFIVDILNVYGW